MTARRDGRWCWPRELVIAAGTARAEREDLVLWPLGTIAGGLAGAGSSLSALGMFCTRSAGGFRDGVQGPSGSFASYQKVPLDR